MSNNRVSNPFKKVRNVTLPTSDKRTTKKASKSQLSRLGNLLDACGSCRFILLAIVLALASVVSTQAQTSGTISGHVSDPTGATIPQAAVTLTNMATGSARSTVTTEAGDYTFTAVPPAVYTIQATHSGF